MARIFDMQPPKGGLQSPSEDVLIELGDGKKRPLRFSISTLKVLRSVGIDPIAPKFTVDDLPTLVWAGLHDQDGMPPSDVTVQDLERLPVHWVEYLSKAFSAAYQGSMPEKPEKTESPEAGEIKNVQSPAA